MGGTRKLKRLTTTETYKCNDEKEDNKEDNKESGKCKKKPKISSPKKPRKTRTTPATVTKKSKVSSSSASSSFNQVLNYKLDNSRNLQLCTVSSFCISFGHHSQDIFTFFDSFSWKYIDETKIIQRIGEVSSNGFNYVIPFKRDKYDAYCVLKSCIDKWSDNLKYEACVGNFVNKLHRQYPIFVYTYRFGKYSDVITFLKMKNDLINMTNDFFKINKPPKFAKDIRKIAMTPISEFSDETKMIDIINDSCVKSEYNCILIEHIPTSVTLNQYMSFKKNDAHFWEFDIINILFQIYSVLSQISDVFTHYDLHSSNVLLYLSVEENVCVEMRYHLPGDEIVTIYTNHVAKIIDYGRCFFHETETMNSKKYHDLVCEAKECKPDCGEDYGYDILNNNNMETDFITPQKRNRSHDLRLWSSIVTKWLKKREHACPEYISALLNKIFYKSEYGTPESKNHIKNNRVATVQDAYQTLLSHMKKREFKELNAAMAATTTHRKIGVLDIWIDGTKTPMQLL